MGHRQRRLMVLVLLAVAPALLSGGPRLTAQEPANGIAAKRPVFGGACPACPWGAMADVVKEAMKPAG